MTDTKLVFALMTASTNIKNCYKKKQNFDDDSLTNFKNNKRKEAEIIETSAQEDITDAEEWIETIENLIKSLNDNNLNEIHAKNKEDISLIKKKNVMLKDLNVEEIHKAIINALIYIRSKINISRDAGFDDKAFAEYKEQKADNYKLINNLTNLECNTSQEWYQFLVLKITESNDETLTGIATELVDDIEDILKKKRVFKKAEAAHLNENIISDSEIDRIFENNNRLYVKKDIVFGKDRGEETKEQPQRNERQRHEEPIRNDFASIEAMTHMAHSFEFLAKSTRTKDQVRIESLKNDSQDVQEWFGKFERQTAMYTEEEQGLEIAKWLEETALRCWELMNESDKQNYKKVKKTILKNFRAEDSTMKACSKFYSMKQEMNESVDEFLYKLLKCKKEWPPEDSDRFDRDVCPRFKNGLKIEIASVISTFKSSNLDEVYRKAKEIENLIRRKEENTTIAEISVNAISNSKSDAVCFKCKNTGHFSKECKMEETNEKREFKNDRKNLFCLFCGKNNHLTINCRLMNEKFKELENRKSKYSQDKSSFRKKYCSRCKMTNHDTSECRRKTQTDDSKEKKTESSSRDSNLN